MKHQNETDQAERGKRLEEMGALAESGYGGIDKNLNIVDRREFPDAIPFPFSRFMGTPQPKKV